MPIKLIMFLATNGSAAVVLRAVALMLSLISIGAPVFADDASKAVWGGAGTILAAGDSLAKGYGIGIAKELADSGWTVENHGVESSSLYAGRVINGGWPLAVRKAVAATRPAVVVLSFGANDAGKSGPGGVLFASQDWLYGYLTEVARVIRAAKSEGAVVLWMSPPLMGGGLLEENCLKIRAKANLVASRAGAVVVNVDLVKEAHPGASLRAKDGIHFTITGYQEIGKLGLLHAARSAGVW